MSMVKQIFSGIYNLIVGLLVTGKHLGRHAITLQYPKERWDIPERSRGVVVLLTNPETKTLNCTSCMLCMKACPSAAIQIEREKNPETRKWQLTKFVVDNTICCFCGMCEEACNFDAIKLAGNYEMSVYNQSELIYDKDRLAELGINVKYTPRPKKKPVAKKPAAAKPAAGPGDKKEAPKDTAPQVEKEEPKVETAKPEKDAAIKEKPQPESEAVTKDKSEENKPDKPVDEKQAGLDLDENNKKNTEN
jgi:NADH-quinone oxidoreductase subunit I